MNKTYRRPRSAAAARARALSSLAVMTMTVATGAHWFGLLETIPFLWSLATAGLMAALSALMALRGLFSLWQFGAEGGRKSVWALLMSILVLAPFAFAGMRWLTLPQINQVSTDTANPPSIDFALTERNHFTNRIGEIDPGTANVQREYYPEINGRRYSLATDQLEELVMRILNGRGWPVLLHEGTGMTDDPIFIQTVGVTAILRLPSDIAIRIAEDGETSIVDMRSASRYGQHDFGINNGLVTGFLDELDAAVAAPEDERL